MTTIGDIHTKQIAWCFWRKVTLALWWKILLLLYIAFPLCIKCFPSILLNMVFSHHINAKVLNKLSKPKEAWGTGEATNYNILSSSGNHIGVWHMPPHSSSESLSKAKNVILYCHGKRGHRGSGHRVPFYDVLRKLNFHIITFDYSGFGDSEGTPNGRNVVEDTVSTYNWSINQIPNDSLVILWGHSLGSGICSVAMDKIRQKNLRQPNGFVLESPFTNLQDAMHTHPFAKLAFKMYPYIMTYLVNEIFEEYQLNFPTETFLPQVDSHLLLLHSEDDIKIKVQFSETLFRSIAGNDLNKNVRSLLYVQFDKKHHLGHSDIYQSPHLVNIIKKFVNQLNSDQKKYLNKKIKV